MQWCHLKHTHTKEVNELDFLLDCNGSRAILPGELCRGLCGSVPSIIRTYIFSLDVLRPTKNSRHLTVFLQTTFQIHISKWIFVFIRLRIIQSIHAFHWLHHSWYTNTPIRTRAVVYNMWNCRMTVVSCLVFNCCEWISFHIHIFSRSLNGSDNWNI